MLQEFVAQVGKAARAAVEGMHTAVPGEITAYDAVTGLARVRPKAKFVKPDGSTMDYPEITDVPVVFPQSQHAAIAWPIKKGDGCLIVFAEKALDYWRYGQETDTQLSFDLSSAIAIPGLKPEGNPVMQTACEEDAVVVTAGGVTLKVQESGVTIRGNLTVQGEIAASGDVKARGSVSLAGHVHTADGSTTSGPR